MDQAKVDAALRYFESMGPSGVSRPYRHGIALAAAYREQQEQLQTKDQTIRRLRRAINEIRSRILPPQVDMIAHRALKGYEVDDEYKELRVEKEQLEEQLRLYREGYQGSCMACEPVALRNRELEEKLQMAKALLIRWKYPRYTWEAELELQRDTSDAIAKIGGEK